MSQKLPPPMPSIASVCFSDSIETWSQLMKIQAATQKDMFRLQDSVLYCEACIVRCGHRQSTYKGCADHCRTDYSIQTGWGPVQGLDVGLGWA